MNKAFIRKDYILSKASSTVSNIYKFWVDLTTEKKYDSRYQKFGTGLLISESCEERQRLAIARAILKDPPILILDEATSAVDNETEAAIQKSLQLITQNRTTIAIAHRLSTIRHSHCICVMNKGQIVEQGNHEELLGLGGMYAELWHIQMGMR